MATILQVSAIFFTLSMNRLPRDTLKIADNRQGFPMTYPFGVRLAGYVRRRLGLSVIRLRHHRARFGAVCDVGRGFRLTMAPRAHVHFGARCSIDRGLTIEASGIIDIGANTIFGHHCTIAARSSVIVGQDCLIAELVSIRDHDHTSAHTGVPTRSQGEDVAPVRIGNNVWLGAKVTVLKGVSIGDGAIVGANAVVTSDLPPGAVAVGVPARMIRTRSDG